MQINNINQNNTSFKAKLIVSGDPFKFESCIAKAAKVAKQAKGTKGHVVVLQPQVNLHTNDQSIKFSYYKKGDTYLSDITSDRLIFDEDSWRGEKGKRIKLEEHDNHIIGMLKELLEKNAEKSWFAKLFSSK